MYRLPILELLQDCEDPPLNSDSLAELQSRLNIELPKQYYDFLLQFNGGSFQRLVGFQVHEPTEWVNRVVLSSFLGEPGEEASESITWHVEVFDDRIPDGYLAIADCNGVDLVLLCVDKSRSGFGSVWFWDSSGVASGDPGEGMHWLADSFAEFLSMLQPDLDCEDHETIPIFQAIEYGNLRAVDRFLTEGGNVESRNAEERTLLMAAAIYSWPKIVRLLLDHSADPNSRDKQGLTPLHHAAKHSIDSVKLLLAAGADAKARDGNGKGVLADWSYRADQILREHGAVD